MKNIFIFLFTLTFFSCTSKKEQSNTQTIPQTAGKHIENVSLLLSVDKKDGNQTPNFFWTNAKGENVSFAEVIKGKAVLLNFWATWCGPCVKEIPDLVELSKEFESKGGIVIGVSVDRDDDALKLVASFAKEKNMTYPIIIDNGDLEQAFGGIRGIPTTFMITKDGKIVNKLVGLQSKEKFTQELNALL